MLYNKTLNDHAPSGNICFVSLKSRCFPWQTSRFLDHQDFNTIVWMVVKKEIYEFDICLKKYVSFIKCYIDNEYKNLNLELSKSRFVLVSHAKVNFSVSCSGMPTLLHFEKDLDILVPSLDFIENLVLEWCKSQQKKHCLMAFSFFVTVFNDLSLVVLFLFFEITLAWKWHYLWLNARQLFRSWPWPNTEEILQSFSLG